MLLEPFLGFVSAPPEHRWQIGAVWMLLEELRGLEWESKGMKS